MPIHQKSGQTKGSAHVEFFDSQAAKTAVTHMNTGLLDGATLLVELSDPPRSPSPPRRPYSPPRRNRRPPSPVRNRRPPQPARRRTPPRRFGGDSYRPRSLSPSRRVAVGADHILAAGPDLVRPHLTHVRREVCPDPGAGPGPVLAPAPAPTPARLRGQGVLAEARRGLAPPSLKHTLHASR
ncbi:hypothetical protein RSOLAG1IB_03608 [Rhizoctonia solani AG-1 IB]|uniref:RRM domain-containing protein n=1 Tax=Thanatephorus cucumeris (strain AG1-IB / isolate 7/3/14) TaxID=1108050 RepID=A0A0B7FPS5_THACB|nr:hypothetical protein RSOLAG1IB_03608 [Rhizoctonia solani AG-1 IB]